MILYHGTRSAALIRQRGFRRSTGGEFGPGVYLSEDPNTAAFYALRVARGDEPPMVVTVVASILNPFVV